MSEIVSDLLTCQTRYILTQLFKSDEKNIGRFLHPDVMWIGSEEDQYVRGREKVSLFLRSLSQAAAQTAIRHGIYDFIYYDASLAIVTGCFNTYAADEPEESPVYAHRVTFIWKLLDSGWKVFHIHISGQTLNTRTGQETDSAAQEGEAPSHTPQSRKEGQQKNPGFHFRGKNASIYFLKAEDILYVEASNINCTVHTNGEPLFICHPISEIRQILPSSFIRIHRSFIVNREYVAEIRRYHVRLRDGTSLPIPEKRYRSVKELLDVRPPNVF